MGLSKLCAIISTATVLMLFLASHVSAQPAVNHDLCHPHGNASSPPSIFYSDRASFLACVGESITDGYTGYGDPNTPVQLSNAAMSAVLGETEYETLSCADCNLV